MLSRVFRRYFSNSEEVRLGLLILVTMISWFNFPLMVKQLNPPIFLAFFAGFLVLVSGVCVLKKSINRLSLSISSKTMLVAWVGYLLLLLYATLESSSTYSLIQWGILFAKFLFFIFLLLYLNEKFIVTTLRLYANLMVLTVVLAIIAVAFTLADIEPLGTINLGGRLSTIYYGAYYTFNTPLCMPTPVFRIQGLSEEPATYAFILLPALFWLLIVEKAYIRSTIILTGLVLSMSLGVGLFLLMLLPIMLIKYYKNYVVSIYIISAIGFIFLTYNMSDYCLDSHIKNLSNKELSIMAQTDKSTSTLPFDRPGNMEVIKKYYSASSDGKSTSIQYRIEGVRIVLKYLDAHNIGTGTSMGMKTVNHSIAVGYAVAALESGVVGGILYLCLFVIMGWLALMIILTSKMDTFDNRVRIVVALSVCTVITMGTQRMQPDLSFWHMWIYAMFFYLLQKDFSRKLGG